MEQIIWKSVVGFEDRYEISNDGRVRSLDVYVKCRGGKTRLFKGRNKLLYRNNRGYVIVNLCRDNKTAYSLVHRLVAEAFIPNPYNKPQVNHIDGDNTNNCVDNLEWVTDNENKAHSAISVGGTQRPKRPVVVTNIATGERFHFGGLREAERALSLEHSSCLAILKGRNKKHRGFTIAYMEGGDA